MSRALITESYLTGIANAIRAKLGVQDTYTPPQMAAAIESIPTGGITPTGTKNITQNGTHDVTQYASANVNVPNSYAAGDEGKVVSNGALVAQGSDTVTQNGTVDTTLISSLLVNVSGGASGPQASIGVSGGVLASEGVTIIAQPDIQSDEMAATSSAGLAFSFDGKFKLIFEFDYTFRTGGGKDSFIVLSFGGSNNSNGVYSISDTRFGLYANGQRFNEAISISANTKYKCRVELSGSVAKLYIDDTLAATGTSAYVANAIIYALSGNAIAMLYNQSDHTEYNNSLVNNVKITVENGGGGGGYTGAFIYSINLSQGGVWIDTGIDISVYTSLDCVNKTSGNYTQIVLVAVSSIPIKTGSQDVFLTVFKNGGKDFNLRIENGTLRMSFNGTGSNIYETLVFGDGNLSSLLQGGTT